MTAPQNFRSAFNGFNREDVVHYIEYLNARHTTEVNQLNAELDLLRAKLDEAENNTELQKQLAEAQESCDRMVDQLADQQTAMELLEAHCAELEAAQNATDPVDNLLITQLEARCASLERQLQAATTARIQAETERDTARANASHCRIEQELEAYRRAERTERVAKERAEQVYHQANGALADATMKVDEAFAQIDDLTDKVSVQLAQLQAAVSSSKQALADAAATLYTIRPGTTED